MDVPRHLAGRPNEPHDSAEDDQPCTNPLHEKQLCPTKRRPEPARTFCFGRKGVLTNRAGCSPSPSLVLPSPLSTCRWLPGRPGRSRPRSSETGATRPPKPRRRSFRGRCAPNRSPSRVRRTQPPAAIEAHAEGCPAPEADSEPILDLSTLAVEHGRVNYRRCGETRRFVALRTRSDYWRPARAAAAGITGPRLDRTVSTISAVSMPCK
jgi:hypothetical protein